MGCNSSSVKNCEKLSSVTDPDMNNLGVPAGSFPALGSPQRAAASLQGGRNKVQLTPGHSLMDWIRLGRSGKDLTSVGGRKLEVTPEELKKHNTNTDTWIALRGKVYNVTPYLDFHPGGIDELMRAAGGDATALFDEIHKWVNAESMLEKCLVGKLKTDTVKNSSLRKDSLSKQQNGQFPAQFLAPATPPPQIPRFDWYQSNKTVSVIVYTKWTAMRRDLVIVDKQDKTLLVTMFIRHSVYTAHIELERDVTDEFHISVSSDSGKTEVLFTKQDEGTQWAMVGKYLDQHNQLTKYTDYNPAYRDCTIENVESVTKDTKLFTVCLPATRRMSVPIGYHIRVKHSVSDVEVVRSYTTVLPSLQADGQDSRVHEGRAFHLMIKIYPDGVVTPWLSSLKPGDQISVSSFDGNFDLARLNNCTHLVMVAAGTGFTPMVRLLYHSLVEHTQSSRIVKLLFFNKTESDILWREQLSALAESNSRFTFTNCLSEAGPGWTGLTGRVSKEMLRDFLPQIGTNDKLLICACGPTPFTKSVIQYAEELGHKEAAHAFLG